VLGPGRCRAPGAPPVPVCRQRAAQLLPGSFARRLVLARWAQPGSLLRGRPGPDPLLRAVEQKVWVRIPIPTSVPLPCLHRGSQRWLCTQGMVRRRTDHPTWPRCPARAPLATMPCRCRCAPEHCLSPPLLLILGWPAGPLTSPHSRLARWPAHMHACTHTCMHAH